MKTDNKVRFLSILGLIPFVLSSFGVWFIPFNLPYEVILMPFFLYALMINSFLSGNLWAYNLQQRRNPLLPIVFFFMPIVVFAIVGFTAYQAFQLQPLLGLSAVFAFMTSFASIYLYELKTQRHDDYYMRLRFFLTLIVIVCHVCWVVFFARILSLIY
ncbi:MAG: DUF3429 domain-containing protein [Pseudomonadota bacterium]|nr:DUF3429 domain-containing protein [Pseudomonadota bacterium]